MRNKNTIKSTLFKALFAHILSFKGRRAYAFECAILAIGWNELIATKTQQEMANRWGVSKQSVNRTVKTMQLLLDLYRRKPKQYRSLGDGIWRSSDLMWPQRKVKPETQYKP